MLTKEDVAFRHYREFNADGSVNPRGGVTVVFPKSNSEYTAYAYCSRDDNFHYEFGRDLALLRLNDALQEFGGKIDPPTMERSEVRFMLDYHMALRGYRHITRSKNRRNRNEA